MTNEDYGLDIQQSAVTLLGHIKSVDAHNILFHMLINTSSELRENVLEALCQHSQYSTIRELFAALSNEDRKTQFDAINGIYKIAGIRGLISALGESESKAYWRICNKLSTTISLDDSTLINLALKSQDVRIKGLLAEVIRRNHFDSFCDELKELIDDEVGLVRGLAIRAIGDLKCSGAIRKLQSRLKDNTKVYTGSEITVADYAAIALGKLRNVSAIPKLLTILTYSENDELKMEIKTLFSNWQDKAAFSQLINQLREDEVAVCDSAEDLLTNFSSSEYVKEFINYLDDEDWYVRFGCARILGNLYEESAIEALTTKLSDEDCDVRAVSIKSLGMIGGNEVVPILIKSLSDECDCRFLKRKVCDYAAEALEEIGTAEANEAVANWRIENDLESFDGMDDIPF